MESLNGKSNSSGTILIIHAPLPLPPRTQSRTGGSDAENDEKYRISKVFGEKSGVWSSGERARGLPSPATTPLT